MRNKRERERERERILLNESFCRPMRNQVNRRSAAFFLPLAFHTHVPIQTKLSLVSVPPLNSRIYFYSPVYLFIPLTPQTVATSRLACPPHCAREKNGERERAAPSSSFLFIPLEHETPLCSTCLKYLRSVLLPLHFFLHHSSSLFRPAVSPVASSFISFK